MARWPDGFGPSALRGPVDDILRQQAKDGSLDYPTNAHYVDGLLSWIMHRLEVGATAPPAPEAIDAIAIGLGRRLQVARLAVATDADAYYLVKRAIMGESGFDGEGR